MLMITASRKPLVSTNMAGELLAAATEQLT